MKTFKVYMRYNGKADVAYFQAPSLEALKWRVLGRFYYAVINKVVQVA